jgi:hypothetical protein
MTVLFVSVTIIRAGSPVVRYPYSLLAAIKSPSGILAPLFPAQYQADLACSGSLADEINAVMDTLGFDSSRFRELYDRKNGFRWILDNTACTARTRDRLTGILNPVEMTDAILNSVLKYQSTSLLGQLQNETVAAVERRPIEGDGTITIILVPKGARFCYAMTDRGAYTHETWLTGLEITLDTITSLAKKMTLKKWSRTVTPDSSGEAQPKQSLHTYTFSYTVVSGSLLPSRLTFAIDSAQACSITAGYRRENGAVVFDTREITYFLPDRRESRLRIDYTGYSFGPFERGEKEISSSRYATRLKRAAKLSRKAMGALNKGDILQAAGHLKAIIQNFPGTPQAVEATRLLSGLVY